MTGDTAMLVTALVGMGAAEFRGLFLSGATAQQPQPPTYKHRHNRRAGNRMEALRRGDTTPQIITLAVGRSSRCCAAHSGHDFSHGLLRR